MDTDNPDVALEAAPQGLPDASKAARFVNLLVDSIAFVALEFLIVVFMLVLRVDTGFMDTDFWASLFGIAVMALYYVGFESTFGRTLGKFVTGTKVVDAYDRPPTFGQVLMRTLFRFMPFEPFSFFGKNPGGWHDSVCSTRVVQVRAMAS